MASKQRGRQMNADVLAQKVLRNMSHEQQAKQQHAMWTIVGGSHHSGASTNSTESRW